MEYQKLKEALMQSAFTEAQFREVKAIADIRLGNFSSQDAVLKDLRKGTSDVYGLLFHGRLAEVLHQQCAIDILPYAKLRSIQPKVFKELVKAANELYAISEKWNQDKARSRKFAIGVFHLYSRLVVEYLRRFKVPVALRTCLQHVDKFEGMVDDAFPNYVRSGCISMVVLSGGRHGKQQ